nr:hypothetical protein [Tanacetum cinerariifolium]
EIFTELSRIGYEKPSTKLTFYKEFLSPQWKFLIHTILQCMSAKRTSWNEFSSSMASAVICLSTGKGFSGVDTPLFEGMIVAQQDDDVADEGPASVAVDDVHAVVDEPSIPSPTLTTQPPPPSQDLPSTSQTAEIEKNADVQGRQAESQAQIYQINLEHADKVLSMQDVNATITAADTSITAAAFTAALSAARRRKGVVIRDPKETATPSIIIHLEPKSKNKGKRILVEEPKPLKKQAQIEQDEAFARELEAELNKNINWDEVIEQVQRKEKKDNAVMRYQALKRNPQIEAQARKNMMIYLRNMAGFKIDYFKGMSYDDIHPIFEKYFNSNVAFLEKTKEQLEEEESRALKRKTKS